MSLKAKPQLTELDHIRDTLTSMVDTVGETRRDVKQLDAKVDNNHKELCSRLDQQDKRFDQYDKRFDQYDKRFDQHDKRFDQHDKRFDQHDKRFDQHDKRFDQQDKDNAEIKEMLSAILSRLPNN